MTLSDKINRDLRPSNIPVNDVKEFIKELKKEISKIDFASISTPLRDKVDKLAGDKLI